MGKGGTSGAVSFPPYIQQIHEEWLWDSGLTGMPTITNKELVEVMNEAFDVGGNPFDPSSAVLTDPATWFAANQTRWDTFNSKVIALNPATNWGSHVDSAKAKVDAVGILQAIDVSSLIDTAQTKAVAVLGAATPDSGVAPATDVPAYMAAAVTKLAEAGVLNPTDITSILDQIRTATGTQIDEAIVKAGATTPASADFSTLADAVKNKIVECGFISKADWQSIVTNAAQQAASTMRQILETIHEAISDEVLAPILSAMEARAEVRKGTAIRGFTAAMADANAVHGSAFIIGLALVHSQHTADLNMQEGQLVLQMYQGAMNAHINSLAREVQAATQIQFGNVQMRNEALTRLIQAMVALRTFDNGKDNTILQLHTQSYTQQASAAIQAAVQDKQSRDGLLADAVRMMTQLAQVNTDYNRSFLAVHEQAFAHALDGQVRGKMMEKQSRDQMLIEGVRMVESALGRQLQFEQAATSLQTELNRVRYVGTHEHELAQIDLDVQYATWEFKVFEMGANILGAPSGMSAVLPPGLSKGASALSGALSGAGMGAAAGAIGGPVGAAIGAGIGGLLGGIGGLLSA